ncbi:hypothetical protein ZHAS_00009973 [Anopheles sinensis]|uniref:Uncharacterized protein n=1 Tax=Anopheles sinensis TaxID=74873 RepID=A0A084VWE7_ANOSI|nr:hypothetical protein ZHAS_00009973 [Anopheles sinensis]
MCAPATDQPRTTEKGTRVKQTLCGEWVGVATVLRKVVQVQASSEDDPSRLIWLPRGHLGTPGNRNRHGNRRLSVQIELSVALYIATNHDDVACRSPGPDCPDKSSPLSSSSGGLQIDSYVKVCWVTFYICIICTQREAKSGSASANVSMAEATTLELDPLSTSYPVPPPPAATISSAALTNVDSCVLFVPR